MDALMRAVFDVLWKVNGLKIKDGSIQVVCAGQDVKSAEEFMCAGHQAMRMTSMKCLGYDVQCNGSTSISASKMVGLLRAKIAQGYAFLHHSGVEAWSRARRLKMQIRGVVGFFGPFLNPNRSLFARLAYVSNSSARIVDCLPVSLDVRSVLRSTVEMYGLSVEHILCQALVRRIGHVFRQRSSDLLNFYNFDWNAFCQSKRVLHRRGAFSTASLRVSGLLRSLGVDFEGAGSGGIGTRNCLGAPCRLWSPWFAAIREQEGLGWLFEKLNKQLIEERVQILLGLFVVERGERTLALPFAELFEPICDA